MEHIYYGAWAARINGDDAAAAFKTEHRTTRNPFNEIAPDFLAKHGLSELPRFDLATLGRPFAAAGPATGEQLDAMLSELLRVSTDEAHIGNVSSPVKAALDVLRDIRDVLRSNVEFEGLNADSFAQDFNAKFKPLAGLLAAGPPAFRLEQLIALRKAGIVSVLGPDVAVECRSGAASFLLRSRTMSDSCADVTWLVDSRVPFPSLVESESPLLRALTQRGIIRSYIRRGRCGTNVVLGGIDCPPGTFNVIGACGNPNKQILAIGLPTEVPRWFTQVGSGTPGVLSRFSIDADAVASAVLKPIDYPAAKIRRAEEFVT